MSSIGTGYDLSASQFSIDGKVFQVEYAQKAVENSGTVVGIRGRDGVVFAVEKLVLSKLYEEGTNRRIFNITDNIGMAVAGLLADAEQIHRTALNEAENYLDNYGDEIPVKILAERLGEYMHAYTLYSYVRPFGCSIMLASYEDQQPLLYSIEPSGVCQGYYGCALGKGKQAAKTELEKVKMNTLSNEDLAKEAAKIVQSVHDDLKDKIFELELSWVGKDTHGHSLVPDAIRNVAIKYAQDQLKGDDSDEEM